MEIKQIEPKDKVLTFFGEFKSATVESAIKEIVKINISDQEYQKQCRQWAIENGQYPSPAKLTPIEFFLSTYGGASKRQPCYRHGGHNLTATVHDPVVEPHKEVRAGNLGLGADGTGTDQNGYFSCYINKLMLWSM